MIQIENISKVFRTTEVETVALNHVNLEVKEGEFVAIMGPSGCGKSTLLNILGLLDNPTEGSYLLMGEEVAGLKEKEYLMMNKQEMQAFRELFSKYCRQEINKGHCESDGCEFCSVNSAYDEIFNRFSDDEEDDTDE